jgi:hypothetical protein
VSHVKLLDRLVKTDSLYDANLRLQVKDLEVTILLEEQIVLK